MQAETDISDAGTIGKLLKIIAKARTEGCLQELKDICRTKGGDSTFLNKWTIMYQFVLTCETAGAGVLNWVTNHMHWQLYKNDSSLQPTTEPTDLAAELETPTVPTTEAPLFKMTAHVDPDLRGNNINLWVCAQILKKQLLCKICNDYCLPDPAPEEDEGQLNRRVKFNDLLAAMRQFDTAKRFLQSNTENDLVLFADDDYMSEITSKVLPMFRGDWDQVFISVSRMVCQIWSAPIHGHNMWAYKESRQPTYHRVGCQFHASTHMHVPGLVRSSCASRSSLLTLSLSLSSSSPSPSSVYLCLSFSDPASSLLLSLSLSLSMLSFSFSLSLSLSKSSISSKAVCVYDFGIREIIHAVVIWFVLLGSVLFVPALCLAITIVCVFGGSCPEEIRFLPCSLMVRRDVSSCFIGFLVTPRCYGVIGDV